MTTREKHNNELSTLDLALSTPNLTAWIASCKVANHTGSDHKPVLTTIQLGSQVCTNQEPKCNFKKVDTEAILARAAWLQILVYRLCTEQDIDNYIDYLV